MLPANVLGGWEQLLRTGSAPGGSRSSESEGRARQEKVKPAAVENGDQAQNTLQSQPAAVPNVNVSTLHHWHPAEKRKGAS